MLHHTLSTTSGSLDSPYPPVDSTVNSIFPPYEVTYESCLCLLIFLAFGAFHNYCIIIYLISKESLWHSPVSSSLLSITSEESSLLVSEWTILNVSLFDVRKSDSLRVIVEQKRFLKGWRLIFDLLLRMTDRVRRRGKGQYMKVRRGLGDMLGRKTDWEYEVGHAREINKWINTEEDEGRREGTLTQEPSWN